MSDDINIGVNVETKIKGKDILDLCDDFNAMNSILKRLNDTQAQAEATAENYRGGIKNLNAALKEVAQDSVKVDALQKKMSESYKTQAKDTENAASKITSLNNTIKQSPAAMETFIKAEKLAGGSLDELMRKYDAASRAYDRVANKRNKVKQAGTASPDEIIKINEQLVKQAVNLDRAAGAVESYRMVLGKMEGELKTFKGSSSKSMDGVIWGTAEATKYAAMLNTQLTKLQAVQAKPGTEKYAQTQSQIAAITARLNTIIAEENKLLDRNATIAERAANAKKKAAEAMLRAEEKSSAATAKAEAKAAKAGYSGSLANRVGSGDVGLLANLSRLGVVNPQIAQLSYVLSAVTSTGMLAAVGITAVGAAAVVVGKQVLDAAGQIQAYQITLQALSTHGWDKTDTSGLASQSLGKAASGDMLEYAANSVYKLDKVAGSTEKLVGYGIDMRAVNTEMKMLGDLALGDSERLNYLAIAYGQTFGQGKARAQEMYQFVNAGIPIFEEMAQKLTKANKAAAEAKGLKEFTTVTTKDVMNMTKAGDMDFNKVRDLLKDLTSEGGRYFEIMSKISHLSYEGQKNMLANQLMLLSANIGESLLPNVIELLKQANLVLENQRKGATQKTLSERLNIRDTFSSPDAVLGDMTTTALKAYTDTYERAQAIDKLWKSKGADMSAGAWSAAGRTAPTIVEYALTDWAATLAPKEGQTDASYKKQISDAVAAGITLGLSQENVWTILQQMNYPGITAAQQRQFPTSTDLVNGMAIPKPYNALTRLSSYTSTAASGVTTIHKTPALLALQKIANETVQTSRDAVAAGNKITKSNYEYVDSYTKKFRVTPEIGTPGLQNEDLGSGSGKTREYKLTAYNKGLEEQITRMKELVPLYQEYVNIQGMYNDDTKNSGAKDKNGKLIQDAMSIKAAKAAQLKAKANYAEAQVLTQVNSAYGYLYTSMNKYQMLQEADLQIAAKKIVSDMKIAGGNEQLAATITKLSIKLMQNGISLQEGAEGAERLAKALGLVTEKAKDSAASIALANYEDIIKVLNSVRPKDNQIDSINASIAEFVAAVGADEFIKASERYQELIGAKTGSTQKIPVTAMDYKAQGIQQSGLDADTQAIMIKELAQQTLNNATYKSDYMLPYVASDISLKPNENFTGISGASGIISNVQGSEKLRKIKDARDKLDLYALLGGNEKSSDWQERERAQGTRSDLRVGTAATKLFPLLHMFPGNVESAEDQIVKKQKMEDNITRAKSAMLADPGNADKKSIWEQETLKLSKYEKGLKTAAETGKFFKNSMKDAAQSLAMTGLNGASDAFYEIGNNLRTGGDAAEGFQQSMIAVGKTMLNQLPGILMSAAAGVLMTSGGAAWPLALGLVGAALGTAFLGGILGTKDTVAQDNGSDTQMEMLSNLQAQFQIMIDQFQQNIMYLDVMRAKYIVDTQVGLVSGYANGDVFPGSTGLQQGVYNQPTFFRFANGGQFNGVMGEAGAEAIMPLTRGADGKLGVAASGSSGGKTVVVVNNYSDATVTTSETTDADGVKQIMLLIEKQVQGMAAGGKLDGAFRSRYGVRPQAISRS